MSIYIYLNRHKYIEMHGQQNIKKKLQIQLNVKIK